MTVKLSYNISFISHLFKSNTIMAVSSCSTIWKPSLRFLALVWHSVLVIFWPLWGSLSLPCLFVSCSLGSALLACWFVRSGPLMKGFGKGRPVLWGALCTLWCFVLTGWDGWWSGKGKLVWWGLWQLCWGIRDWITLAQDSTTGNHLGTHCGVPGINLYHFQLTCHYAQNIWIF